MSVAHPSIILTRVRSEAARAFLLLCLWIDEQPALASAFFAAAFASSRSIALAEPSVSRRCRVPTRYWTIQVSLPPPRRRMPSATPRQRRSGRSCLGEARDCLAAHRRDEAGLRRSRRCLRDVWAFGAGDGIRTHEPNLGKLDVSASVYFSGVSWVLQYARVRETRRARELPHGALK